jgi:hypothetical protein
VGSPQRCFVFRLLELYRSTILPYKGLLLLIGGNRSFTSATLGRRTMEGDYLLLSPTPLKSGGLKGSMQHWLEVYPLAFESLTFFVAVD